MLTLNVRVSWHALATTCIKRPDPPHSTLEQASIPLLSTRRLVHPIKTEDSSVTLYNKPKSRSPSYTSLSLSASTSLMLFLHALLFFLLGTSALAIPAPLTYAVSPLDPNRLNGLWREFGLYDLKEFTFSKESSPVKMVKISDGKSAEVLFPKAKTRKLLSEIFPKTIRWVRIRSPQDYKAVTGSDAPEGCIPELKADYADDQLKILFVKRFWPLKNYLAISLNGNKDSDPIIIEIQGA